MAPFESQQNNCTAFSIDICTIHFLALKLIALRIKHTPLGRRWEYDLVKKEERGNAQTNLNYRNKSVLFIKIPKAYSAR